MSAVADLPVLPSFVDGKPKQLLIDGAWAPSASGRVFDSINPSTGQVIAQLAEGGPEDIDRAVAAARRAFEGPWSKFTPAQRQNLMLKLADAVDAHSDEFRLLEVVDMGRPVGNPSAAAAVAEELRYFAGWTTKLTGETVPNSAPGSMFTYTLREPVGVVGAIIPWNAPLHSCIRKIAPVLTTGCTMVLKPAEEASLVPLRLGEIMLEVGIPAGVVNIVTGIGEDAGAALVSHMDVDKVSFTGSSYTGQAIVRAAAGNLKRVSLELGGKSPDIIFADANLDAAVAGAAMGVFRNSGQVCVAGTRVFVERPVYDEVVERFSDFARSLRLGNSLDPETQLGPVVSADQLRRVVGYLESGREEGARAAAGGERAMDGALADGYFVSPTVFADVRDDMRIAEEEIFGPVASMMPFDGIEEVKRRANQTRFGLAGGVWTRDVGKAHELAHGIKSGVVWVNTYGNFDPAMPLGGAKQSGWGNELSGHVLDDYTNIKSVWIRTDV